MPVSPEEQEFIDFARQVGVPDGMVIKGKDLEQLQSAFISFKSRQPSQSQIDLNTARAGLATEQATDLRAKRTAAASAGPEPRKGEVGVLLDEILPRTGRGGRPDSTAAQRRDRLSTGILRGKAGVPSAAEKIKQRVDSLNITAQRQQANAQEFARIVELFLSGDEKRAPNPEMAKKAQKKLDSINDKLARTLGQLSNLNEAMEKVRARGSAQAAQPGANGKAKRACDPNKMVTRIVKEAGGRDRLGNELAIGSTMQLNECTAFEMEDEGYVDPPEDGNTAVTPASTLTPTNPATETRIAPDKERQSLTQAQRRGRRLR